MKTINDRVNSAQSLDELAAILNSAADDEMESVDTVSLPVFGGTEPADTMELWSWDNTRLLVFGNEWEIQDRCKNCGEATFHCDHN